MQVVKLLTRDNIFLLTKGLFPFVRAGFSNYAWGQRREQRHICRDRQADRQAGSHRERKKEGEGERERERVTGHCPECSYLVVASCLPHRHLPLLYPCPLCLGRLLQCASADRPWFLLHRQWLCVKDCS